MGGILLVLSLWSRGADREEDEGGAVGSEPRATVSRYRARVLATHPHDRSVYTQGLVWFEGRLYESGGSYGSSSLRCFDPTTGSVELRRELPGSYFGEGLARVGRRLLQLTWKEQTALVWDLDSLEEIGRFSYEGEGWGLCFEGHRLIMSDGTHRLTFRDPDTFERTGVLTVTLEGEPLADLNELEWAEGWIFANLFQKELIARIDPTTGEVSGLVDASGLLSPRERRNADVLNGIAYRPSTETFFLTGKHWPKLFEVVFEPE